MAFRFSSTAFHFPRNPGKSIYGGKYTKDRYLSFIFQPKLGYSAIKIIGGKNTKDRYPSFVFSAPSFVILATNRHSPHSLASVKDMYVEMGFQLNLYQYSLLILYSKDWTDTKLKQEKCAYQPMILNRRYSNVGLARPLVNISPSYSEVSIFKSLIPRLLISSQNQIVLVA
jgi:hypothetical protein